MLNILPGRLQGNLVEALGHDRCLVHFDYYHAEIDSPTALRQRAKDQAASDRIQAEDAAICERVQQGLGSRAYDRGRFLVEREEGVHHFQAQLKAAYAQWLSEQRERRSWK